MLRVYSHTPAFRRRYSGLSATVYFRAALSVLPMMSMGIPESSDSGVLFCQSRFVRVHLATSVSLDLPRSWIVVDGDDRTTLETAVEAAIDLSGVKPPGFRYGHLLFARSISDDLYASANVNSVGAPGVTAKVMDQLRPDQLSSFNTQLKRSTSAVLKEMDGKIISWGATEIRQIGSRRFLFTEYLRDDSLGPVRVQLVQVFGEGRTITLTLSGRAVHWPVLKPILARIASSLVVS